MKPLFMTSKEEKKPLALDIFFKKNTNYAITINPEDKYQFFGCEKRLERFRDLLNGLFVGYTQFKTEYIHRIELSEPREVNQGHGPRLHTHGILRFKTDKAVHRFLMTEYYKITRLGHVDIDTINDLPTWVNYMYKQMDIMGTPALSSVSFDSKNDIVKHFLIDGGGK